MKKVESRDQLINVLGKRKENLFKRYGVSDIAVFGSYARNEQRLRSDIDILVEFDQSHKTFDNYMELKFFLQRITGGKIDLILKDSIRQELKDTILSEAIHV